MKEQAIDALETVRDDLLAARALAEQDAGGARGTARSDGLMRRRSARPLPLFLTLVPRSCA